MKKKKGYKDTCDKKQCKVSLQKKREKCLSF